MRGDRRYGAFLLLAACMLGAFIYGKGRFERSYADDAKHSASRRSPEPFPGLPIDLNAASMGELMSIPGIGERTATRIVEKREELRGFSAIDELAGVKYIGRARLERLKRFVTVGPRGKGQG